MLNARQINWGPVLFLSLYQTLLLVTLPFYFYFCPLKLSMILASIVLLYLTGLSITGGYHRLYSHRTYKANPVVETLLLFFGAMSCQGSALRWSMDHRIHHAHVDTDNDPYSINKGFWYAHMLWIIEKPREIDPKVVPDLFRNKMVMFQHNFYRLLMFGSNALAFFGVGFLLNDYWGALFLAVGLRMFLLHHFTWFINSLAHTWGDKPFCQEQSAVDNYILSILTFGEGYHNYHHTFANDYRNGIRWFHFDPTKWLIWTLSKLGLVHGLKRMDACSIEKRMVIERKNLLSSHLSKIWDTKKDEVEKYLNEVTERILSALADLNRLKEQYQEIKRSAQRDLTKELKSELKRLQKSIKEDWRQLTQISHQILAQKSLAN
jgi:stearoyl-CoA desaturase (Delta-9 desaturase)